MRGYLKLKNLVVRLRFPFLHSPSRHPAFVERPVIDTPHVPRAEAPSLKPTAPVIQSAVPDALIAHERPPSSAAVQEPFFQ